MQFYYVFRRDLFCRRLRHERLIQQWDWVHKLSQCERELGSQFFSLLPDNVEFGTIWLVSDQCGFDIGDQYNQVYNGNWLRGVGLNTSLSTLTYSICGLIGGRYFAGI